MSQCIFIVKIMAFIFVKYIYLILLILRWNDLDMLLTIFYIDSYSHRDTHLYTLQHCTDIDIYLTCWLGRTVSIFFCFLNHLVHSKMSVWIHLKADFILHVHFHFINMSNVVPVKQILPDISDGCFLMNNLPFEVTLLKYLWFICNLICKIFSLLQQSTCLVTCNYLFNYLSVKKTSKSFLESKLKNDRLHCHLLSCLSFTCLLNYCINAVSLIIVLLNWILTFNLLNLTLLKCEHVHRS